MLPIRNIPYLLPMCCSFWEKYKNSSKTGLGCSTPLIKLDNYSQSIIAASNLIAMSGGFPSGPQSGKSGASKYVPIVIETTAVAAGRTIATNVKTRRNASNLLKPSIMYIKSPPDFGKVQLNSAMHKAPSVENIPHASHTINAQPTEPLVFCRIPLGDMKIPDPIIGPMTIPMQLHRPSCLFRTTTSDDMLLTYLFDNRFLTKYCMQYLAPFAKWLRRLLYYTSN